MTCSLSKFTVNDLIPRNNVSSSNNLYHYYYYYLFIILNFSKKKSLKLNLGENTL